MPLQYLPSKDFVVPLSFINTLIDLLTTLPDFDSELSRLSEHQQFADFYKKDRTFRIVGEILRDELRDVLNRLYDCERQRYDALAKRSSETEEIKNLDDPLQLGT
jgi:hypothetical protein